jgi:hypothetical protein
MPLEKLFKKKLAEIGRTGRNLAEPRPIGREKCQKNASFG